MAPSRLGTGNLPFPSLSLDQQQKVQGYSVDFCLKIVDSVKAQPGRPDLEVRYVPTNVANRIALVANGTVDLDCGTTTNTLQRQEQVEFSPIIYLTGAQMLVRTDSPIKDYEDLAGKRIAMLQGSTTEVALRTLSDQKKFNIQIVFAADNAQATLLVQSDRVDAFHLRRWSVEDHRRISGAARRFTECGRSTLNL